MKYGEPVFDILYLLFAIISGCLHWVPDPMKRKNMNIKEAEMLFIELRDYLRQLDQKDLRIQTRNASDAVMYLSEDVSDEEKEEIIRLYYRYLYPSRGGLTDVVLWDSDFEKRIALNAPLERIGKKLAAICRN